MRDDNTDFGAYLPKTFFNLAHRRYAVVEKEHLSAARKFRLDRTSDDHIAVAHYNGFDRDALARRRTQKRQIPRARHRHVKSPRYRRRRKGKNVRSRPQALQKLLVPYAEALLLVDYDKPQILKPNL